MEFPLLEQGGVARSAGVVRNGDPTNQIGALYVYARKANMTFFLIVLMTASDVIAGFTVTISTARRDMQHP